jgi:hypothetical protein
VDVILDNKKTAIFCEITEEFRSLQLLLIDCRRSIDASLFDKFLSTPKSLIKISIPKSRLLFYHFINICQVIDIVVKTCYYLIIEHLQLLTLNRRTKNAGFTNGQKKLFGGQ